MDKLREIWKNPRYKALIKLSGWFIFFFLIVILCSLSQNNSNLKDNNIKKEEPKKFVELDILQNNILTNTYKYSYKINNLALQTLEVYNGEISDGQDSGYYESKTEVFKYSCTLEKCYKVFTDHQEEYKMDNFALTYIISTFELIKDVSPDIKLDENIKTYSYLVDVQGVDWEVVIKTSLEDITEIYLKTQKETYELKLEK